MSEPPRIIKTSTSSSGDVIPEDKFKLPYLVYGHGQSGNAIIKINDIYNINKNMQFVMLSRCCLPESVGGVEDELEVVRRLLSSEQVVLCCRLVATDLT